MCVDFIIKSVGLYQARVREERSRKIAPASHVPLLRLRNAAAEAGAGGAAATTTSTTTSCHRRHQLGRPKLMETQLLYGKCVN